MTYETTYGSGYAGDLRVDRKMHLSWSSIWGGTVLGWGALILLSLIGVPLTGCFFGKFYIFEAALDAHLVWLAVLGLLNSDLLGNSIKSRVKVNNTL